MLVFILMALIVFIAILVVGYPLVNAQQYQFEQVSGADDRIENLISARENAIDAIRDLEFDHATGKLSDADYKQMRARYDLRAAEVLQKMDAITLGAKKSGGSGKAAAAASGTCPRCKTKLQKDDRFCPTCGQRLA